MKEELRNLLNELSPSDFHKIKQIYSMTNGIKGNTIDEFVEACPDRVVPGVINACKKQLNK